MEKNVIKNLILTNGILLGLSTIMISVLKYAFSENYLEKTVWDQVVGLILIVLFIYFGINSFKKTNNNSLSIRQAIKIGLGITLIFALVNIVYLYVFMTVIEPNFKEQVIEMQIKEMEKANSTVSQIKTSVGFMKEYFVSITLFVTVLFSLFTGLITSLIIGAILKKDNSTIN
jgi:uncharacterized membrane protein